MRTASRLLPLAVLLSLAPTGLNAQGTTRPTLTPELEVVRTALDKYLDPLAAVRDGFLSTVGCVDYPGGGHGDHEMAYKPGGMGVHFVNLANVSPTPDPLKPPVLIYEPVGDRLRLVAAEWFVPTALAKQAPTVFGTALEGPMEGHEPILPAELHHWDLHVWLWKENPNGLMASTNPTVQCPDGAPYTFHEVATRKVTP